MKCKLAVALLLLLLIGCREKKSYWVASDEDGVKTITIDFTVLSESSDSVGFQKLLPLSELSDDIRVVKFETRDECLIDGNARYRIADSCILVIQSDQVMLFGWDGRFRHTVARGGRGPREISSFSDAVIDEQGDRIYILEEYGKVKIYSLSDTNFFADISLVKEPAYNSIRLSGSGNLLIAPYYAKRTKNMIYKADTAGNLLDSIPCPPNGNPIAYSFNEKFVLSEVDGEFHYLSPGNDTIYRFLDWQFKPGWIFRVAGNQQMNVRGETRNGLLLDLQTIVAQEVSENSSRTEFSVKTYCLDKKDMKMKEIERVLDDRFAQTSGQTHDLHLQSGKWLYWLYAAPKLDEIIATIEEKDGVQQEIKDNLKEFGKTLSPEDNPVLLIGRLK